MSDVVLVALVGLFMFFGFNSKKGVFLVLAAFVSFAITFSAFNQDAMIVAMSAFVGGLYLIYEGTMGLGDK